MKKSKNERPFTIMVTQNTRIPDGRSPKQDPELVIETPTKLYLQASGLWAGSAGIEA